MNTVQTYGTMKYKSTQIVFPAGYLTYITFQSSNYLCFQKLIYYKISPKYNTLAALTRSKLFVILRLVKKSLYF